MGDFLEALDRAHARGPQMIDSALELAAVCWEVFPCKPHDPGGKAPLTRNGHLDATMDPDQIKAWWTRWPAAMIGARVPESLLVIDVDPRNGGSVADLESLTGPLPATLTAWSGRNDGGRHLYYLRPAGPLAGTRLPKGIDLKVNGYCIVPPSIHPATSQPYRWEHHPVAALPSKLRELLCPRPKPVHTFGDTKNGSGLIRTVAEAPDRTRHNALVWASYRARDDGILDQITEELVAAAVAAGGETETSARRVIASVQRAAS
jgi:Bifunctional DNA primase/polymerase, N-terminal